MSGIDLARQTHVLQALLWGVLFRRGVEFCWQYWKCGTQIALSAHSVIGSRPKVRRLKVIISQCLHTKWALKVAAAYIYTGLVFKLRSPCVKTGEFWARRLQPTTLCALGAPFRSDAQIHCDGVLHRCRHEKWICTGCEATAERRGTSSPRRLIADCRFLVSAAEDYKRIRVPLLYICRGLRVIRLPRCCVLLVVVSHSLSLSANAKMLFRNAGRSANSVASEMG